MTIHIHTGEVILVTQFRQWEISQNPSLGTKFSTTVTTVHNEALNQQTYDMSTPQLCTVCRYCYLVRLISFHNGFIDMFLTMINDPSF